MFSKNFQDFLWKLSKIPIPWSCRAKRGKEKSDSSLLSWKWCSQYFSIARASCTRMLQRRTPLSTVRHTKVCFVFYGTILDGNDPFLVTFGYCIAIICARTFPMPPLNFWKRNLWLSSPTHCIALALHPLISGYFRSWKRSCVGTASTCVERLNRCLRHTAAPFDRQIPEDFPREMPQENGEMCCLWQPLLRKGPTRRPGEWQRWRFVTRFVPFSYM